MKRKPRVVLLDSLVVKTKYYHDDTCMCSYENNTSLRVQASAMREEGGGGGKGVNHTQVDGPAVSSFTISIVQVHCSLHVISNVVPFTVLLFF